MRLVFKFLIALVLPLAIFGCSKHRSASETVELAYEQFDRGKYERCKAIVDSILDDSADFNTLPVSSLCTLAELCIRLDSVDNKEIGLRADEGDAQAARCLGRACELDADSVEAFIRQQPAEKAQRLALIQRVSSYLATPRDSLMVESDTIQ